jgi:hypothetical protein
VTITPLQAEVVSRIKSGLAQVQRSDSKAGNAARYARANKVTLTAAAAIFSTSSSSVSRAWALLFPDETFPCGRKRKAQP